MGRDSAVGIATRYGLDGPGIESRKGEIFRTRPETPGAYPASCTMGTGSFPEAKRPSVALTIHSHLAPRFKKEQSYTSTPPLGLRGLV